MSKHKKCPKETALPLTQLLNFSRVVEAVDVFFFFFGGYYKVFGPRNACISPLSSQESDWKDLRECASLVLLSEKQVTSSDAFPASAEEYNSRSIYRPIHMQIHAFVLYIHTIYTVRPAVPATGNNSNDPRPV